RFCFRGCLRCERFAICAGNRSSTAAPLGEQALGDQFVFRRMIISVVQVRQMIAKFCNQCPIADTRTIGRDQLKDEVTNGLDTITHWKSPCAAWLILFPLSSTIC